MPKQIDVRWRHRNARPYAQANPGIARPPGPSAKITQGARPLQQEPTEWEICVQALELARQHEGEIVYPVCFRDATELRTLDAEPEAGS